MKTIAETTSTRFLEWPEIEALEPMFKQRGWMCLNKETSRIMGTFHEGKLIAFVVLQLVPHLEPLWVDPSYRGAGVAEELVSEIARYIKSAKTRGVMIVADNPGVARLAEHFGMSRILSPVYSKVDMGEGL